MKEAVCGILFIFFNTVCRNSHCELSLFCPFGFPLCIHCIVSLKKCCKNYSWHHQWGPLITKLSFLKGGSFESYIGPPSSLQLGSGQRCFFLVLPFVSEMQFSNCCFFWTCQLVVSQIGWSEVAMDMVGNAYLLLGNRKGILFTCAHNYPYNHTHYFVDIVALVSPSLIM